MTDWSAVIGDALRHRAKHGEHLHHSGCIHNLPPEEQVRIRGFTTERWTQVIGPLPQQIAPSDWQIDAPNIGSL